MGKYIDEETKNSYINWNIGPLCDEIARLEECNQIQKAIKATKALYILLSSLNK